MAALDDLLARIQDVSLRADIERELAPLRGDRELGLVFERHLPEKVRLPGLPVRRGTTVEVRADQMSPTWQVVKVSDGAAELRRRGDDGATITETSPVEELVVVREFGQPIYPGLRSVGRIERGGDKPFHTVINSENYHALETLLYTCENKVDAIYIDPPYNTGARDWKYNNDYVDGNDGYRHSKWLSFMEKRLLLAKRLLNPADSVLIVTIDEKEYLRLGMLLGQIFPEARTQMVSSVIKAGGVSRAGAFGRSDEYLYFLQLGDSSAQPVALGKEWNPVKTKNKYGLRWKNGMRSGSGARRSDSPNLFFPVFVRNTPAGPVFDSVGEAFMGADRTDIAAPAGCEAVWPIRNNGEEGRWMFSSATLRALIAGGHARLGQWNKERTTVYYLARGEREKIEQGVFTVTGHNADGSVVVDDDAYTPEFLPTTQWNIMSHDAGYGGARLLGSMIPGRSFPFPKSLYAVEDTLRFFVKNKPDALVLDFFGGSGTTTHAVMRLNHEDGWRRRSIVVTNNEVSDAEAKVLHKSSHHPGDLEWEALGIFEHITKPRIEAAVTGVTHEGKPVVGDYKFTDEFPMSDGLAENVEFFTLTYEDPDRVQLGVAFETVAPLLWLMAGATGPRIDAIAGSWSIPENGRYGVLFDADAWPDFTEAVKGHEGLTHAFVVTDSDAVFHRVVAELPDTVTPVRLYESYLRSFAINTGARS